jgi:hypothetical protein
MGQIFSASSPARQAPRRARGSSHNAVPGHTSPDNVAPMKRKAETQFRNAMLVTYFEGSVDV